MADHLPFGSLVLFLEPVLLEVHVDGAGEDSSFRFSHGSCIRRRWRYSLGLLVMLDLDLLDGQVNHRELTSQGSRAIG